MKRIKKLLASVAIAFLLVPVSALVLPTDTNNAYATCWDCVPVGGCEACANGLASGWEQCWELGGSCQTDGRCGIFE